MRRSRSPRRGGITVAVAIVLAFVLAGCAYESGEAADLPYLVLGDPDVARLERQPGVFDSSIATYDFDGDGVQEVVAQNSDTRIYVFDSQDGRALATIKTRYPPSWHIDQVSNGVVVASLEPGAPPAIVAANHAGYVGVWTYDAAASGATSFVFTTVWEKRITACDPNPSMDATAIVADLTGDGVLEILVQSEEVGLFALTATGDVLWKQCWGGGNASPATGDLDGDGDVEAVFASDGGTIAVFDGATGTPVWTFDATAGRSGVRPGSITVAPTIAELDGVPPMEVLFTARHAPEDDPDLYEDFNLGVFAVHAGGDGHTAEVLWRVQPEWANPLSYTPLVVEDVDGDGAPEVFGMDWNTIGHRPGDWERLGPGNAFRLGADGDVVWHRAVDAYWSNKEVAIADLNGDGTRELVVNEPQDGDDGLIGLDLASGTGRVSYKAPGWKFMSGPLFVDLDGDGVEELLYRVVPAGDEDRDGAILVHDLDRPGA